MNYFFELIKNNAVLLSIIMNGNFSQIDHKQLIEVDHFFPTDSGLIINDYKLGQDTFKSVHIILTKYPSKTISFFTSDSKYFDNPELYFGKSSDEVLKNPYEMSGVKVNRSRKDLGNFNEFGKILEVTIFKSSVYGYCITIYFDRTS